MRRRILSILLFFSTLVLTTGIIILPIDAQASTPSAITKAGGCVESAAIKSLVDSGLKSVEGKIKQVVSDHLKGALGNFIGGLLDSAIPVNASDPGLLGFFTNKEYRDAVIARCVAREIIDTMTNNMADIIKTRGRDGGPTFVANWNTFMTQAQYRGENIFRAELSTTQMCPYLSDDIKTSYGVDPKKKTPLTGQNTRTDSAQPFSLSTKCTMPTGFTPEKYQQDFAGNGGWDAYARMLEPQNNAWGLSALANDEMAKQRSLQQSVDTNQAIAGRGYVGVSGNGKNDSCSIKGPTGECLFYKDVKTTGDYLSNSTAAAINAEYSWLTTAQGLNTVIENMTQNMINRLFDQSDNTGGTIATPQNVPVPTPTDTSSLSCAEQGLSETYTFNVSSAISSFISSNTAVASLPDDDEGGPNNTAFMNGVVNTLTANGFTAGRILHVATGVPSGDKIIVGKNPPDADGEVYDILNSTGNGAAFNSNGKASTSCVAHADWSKLIPAGSGGNPTPTAPPGPPGPPTPTPTEQPPQ